METEKLYKDKEWLYNKYINERLSTNQICKLCNSGHMVIWEWLHKLNIPVRCNGEAVHLVLANHCNLSRKAINFINGELLGDGSLNCRSSYSARFVYGSKYPEYCQYISDTLDSFGIKQSGKINKRYYKDFNCYSYHYSSLAYVELLSIYKQWYPEKKKIVPRDIKLTPLTCRQWYIGDACLHKPQKINPYIMLATEGFIVSDIKWLIKQLTKLGFKTNISKKLNKFNIRISSYSTKAFLDYVGKSPTKCYEYKFEY